MRTYDIVILGAGFGGLGMAIQLKRAGFDNFVILERDQGVGGTWYRNTYPGCACDVPSRLYWPSFVDQPDWSRAFATQPEILENINIMVDVEGLGPHIRLNTAVRSAIWNESTTCWTIETSGGDIYQAPIFICAAGQLSEPKIADIHGLAEFEGTIVHSARWPAQLDMQGKRVGVVGTGASAIQLMPEIARVAQELTVFQRSSAYVMPRNDVVFSESERALMRSDPSASSAVRDAIFTEMQKILAAFELNSEAAGFVRQANALHLESGVSDPALRARLTPVDAFGCKRPLLSDSYYPTFTQPHVTLVTEAIERIEPGGVRTVDGSLHETDILVLATGFHATDFLKGIEVIGRDGKSLHRDAWATAPEAYKGITVTGFPGFFMIYGPNTNFLSVLAIMEPQFDFIVRSVRKMKEDRVIFEPRPDKQKDYNHFIQERLQNNSPYSSGCTNYYVHPSGRITSNWWGSLDEYQSLLQNINEDEYIFWPVAYGMPRP